MDCWSLSDRRTFFILLCLPSHITDGRSIYKRSFAVKNLNYAIRTETSISHLFNDNEEASRRNKKV